MIRFNTFGLVSSELMHQLFQHFSHSDYKLLQQHFCIKHNNSSGGHTLLSAAVFFCFAINFISPLQHEACEGICLRVILSAAVALGRGLCDLRNTGPDKRTKRTKLQISFLQINRYRIAFLLFFSLRGCYLPYAVLSASAG